MHWGSWDKMTAPKSDGGMGFRDFEAFNHALLAKQFWRISNEPNAFWVNVLKGLYFPNESCMEAKKGASPSWLWSSMLERRDLLESGLIWRVGTGEDINFWGDHWIPSWRDGKVTSNPPIDCALQKVSDFIVQPTVRWNEGKLRSCVSKEEASGILKVPISLSESKDKLVWRFHQSGKYSVKSGYHQAHKAKSRTRSHRPSVSYRIPDKVWTRLWSIPTIPKVLHFMWRVVRNWVASKENLYRKKCTQSPLCSICGEENESIEHILFRCSWAKKVWEECDLEFWIFGHPIVSADKWMEDILHGGLAKETNDVQVGFIFQVCWAIWKGRNNYVFNGVVPCPKKTTEVAKNANSDYLRAVFTVPRTYEKGANIERTGKWNPPAIGFIKFNCDGAFSSSRSIAAFGFLARDSGGSALFWRSGRIVASSAMVTEAWALRIACGTAVDRGINDACFESDCRVVIESINHPERQGPWEISAIIEDVKYWAAQKNWTFSWTCREKNKAAHWLAKSSVQSIVINLSGCIPIGLLNLVEKDRHG